MDNLHKDANSDLFFFARQNRQMLTKAERLMWNCLRGRKLKGFKFRRQHPIAKYMADFYCLECNLVVEIDGEYHLTPEQSFYDKERTSGLRELGIKVIRFSNEQVLKNIKYVLKEIESHLIPNPSAKSGGSHPSP